jgi:hypothetical protein
MNKSFLVQRLIVVFFIVIFSPVLAKGAVDVPLATQTVRDLSSSKSEESVCRAVEKAIKEGQNARTLVKTAIELGNNSCAVIRCAILAGGNLEDIMKGAVDAGTPSDVVSRCCLEAGADPKEVARNLGLGYSQETVAGPSRANPPPANTISPHKF